jgi:hypothetical protein
LVLGDFDVPVVGDLVVGDSFFTRQAAAAAVLARRGRGMNSRNRSDRGESPPGVAAFCSPRLFRYDSKINFFKNEILSTSRKHQ